MSSGVSLGCAFGARERSLTAASPPSSYRLSHLYAVCRDTPNVRQAAATFVPSMIDRMSASRSSTRLLSFHGIPPSCRCRLNSVSDVLGLSVSDVLGPNCQGCTRTGPLDDHAGTHGIEQVACRVRGGQVSTPCC